MLTNRLYNADCMKHLPDFEDNHFDLAIVDPPYGIGDFTESQYSPFSGFDWNKNIPEKKYFDELFRISKDQIIWGGNYYTEYLKPTKSWVVWDKHVTTKNGHARCELAWTSLNKVCDLVDIVWTAGWYRAQRENIIHPCQKPVQLYRWLLQNYAKPGDLILDTHVGSGSSLVACIMEGFDYMGFEIDKEYYDGAMKRINAELQKIPLF